MTSTPHQPGARRRAFTLIELLVVVAIIGLLASLMMSSVTMVRRAAQTTACASNLRQVMMAVTVYPGEWEGVLPTSFDAQRGAYWTKYEILGQYLDLSSSSGGSIANFKGPWRVLKCPNNTQSPTGISYGLNHRFCIDTDPSSPTQVPVPIARLHHISEIGIGTDIAGEGRWYIYTPLFAFGNGDITQLASWSNNYPYNQPFIWVPRHRGGANLGFLDGHVRWSLSLTVEDTAKSVLLRDNNLVN